MAGKPGVKTVDRSPGFLMINSSFALAGKQGHGLARKKAAFTPSPLS
jgi:hypothetical protein